jgi:hypothetical protein
MLKSRFSVRDWSHLLVEISSLAISFKSMDISLTFTPAYFFKLIAVIRSSKHLEEIEVSVFITQIHNIAKDSSALSFFSRVVHWIPLSNYAI